MMPASETRGDREIEHGQYLVEHVPGEVWNWTSPAGQVRWTRRVRMLTAHLAAGMAVLELGCGSGTFTRELAATGARVTALDISADLLELARAEVTSDNVDFVLSGVEEMDFPDERFDSVVGSSVLHHLEVVPALEQVIRVLKPGGSAHFTEPNMMNPQIAVQKNMPLIKRWLGDSPDETAFFRWRLARQLRTVGFEDVRIDCFDFLHPAVPRSLIKPVRALGEGLERLPLLREIAGSLHIRATKPVE